MWTSTHSKVLKTLFRKYDEAGIRWMVFRNFKGLPDSNPSKDVDLLVERKSISIARSILESTMYEAGFKRKTFNRFQCIWCYSFFDVTPNDIISIKIDLFYGLVWRGVPTLTFDEIYSKSVIYNGFRVPNNACDAFMLWIKPIMTGGIVKEKYIKSVLENCEANEFVELIESVFGTKLKNKFIKYLNSDNIKKSGCLQKDMNRKSWINGFFKDPIDSVYSTIMHFVLEIVRRTRRPNNSFICILGPDGVGKTTVINGLSKAASEVFIKDLDNIEVIHFRPTILPNIKKLLNPKIDISKEEFTNPHRGKAAGFGSSLLRCLYYWFDYWIGYPYIKKQCVNGKIVIFDRYIYDFYVDPKRCSIKLPDFLRKIMILSVPQPDKIFILLANPNTIYERKQELEIKEIERQIDEYKNLSSFDEKMEIIYADHNPEDVIKHIINKWVSNLDSTSNK